VGPIRPQFTRKEGNGLPVNTKAAPKADLNGAPVFDEIPFEGEARGTGTKNDVKSLDAQPKGPTSIGMFFDENEAIALDIFFTESMKKIMGFD